MMLHTIVIFRGFLTGKNLPEEQFTREYIPMWTRLDRFGHHAVTRAFFVAGYVGFYILFAPSFWWYLLLPLHFLMGPIQGAVVNWFGHTLGYSNFNNGDHSKNTTPWGFFMMGELFQNNHHHARYNPNFARRWFEFDLTFLVMIMLDRVKIIRLKPMVLLP